MEETPSKLLQVGIGGPRRSFGVGFGLFGRRQQPDVRPERIVVGRPQKEKEWDRRCDVPSRERRRRPNSPPSAGIIEEMQDDGDIRYIAYLDDGDDNLIFCGTPDPQKPVAARKSGRMGYDIAVFVFVAVSPCAVLLVYHRTC